MDLVLLKPGNVDIAEEFLSLIEYDFEDGTTLSGCIELVSCNFGMSQQMTTDVSNQARTSGRPNLNDITVVKYLDFSSPVMYRHCLSATPIDTGEEDEPTRIYLCRNANQAGEENVIAPIVQISLWNCMISSVQAQSHPNDMATEQFTLNYTDIEWTSVHQGVDANAGGNVSYKWSVARNRQTVSG
jgi:type VI secretion system secreted protein Hcp